jgi:hypothetical protein
MADEPRVLANVVSYQDMLDALRSRVAELQIAGEAFDAYAGLPVGYLSKLIGPKPARRLGMISFQPVLAGLGLRLLVVEDAAATARLKSRLKPRNASFVRTMPAAAGIVFTARMLKRIRRLGGQARMAQLTPEQRRELARKAAAARWRKTWSRGV